MDGIWSESRQLNRSIDTLHHRWTKTATRRTKYPQAHSIRFARVWVNFSMGWASQSEAIARTHAMQWNLMYAFVLIVACVRPPLNWVIYALLAGMILQVALQSEIGFRVVDDNYLKIGLGMVAIGWFEFAPWALFTHQLPFWGALALVLIPLEKDD